MAVKRRKMTMLIPGGHGFLRIHDKELSKEVAAIFFSELDMRWGGLEEGVTHVTKRGQLLDA